MDVLSKAEFSKLYKEKYEPILRSLEPERVAMQRNSLIVTLIAALVTALLVFLFMKNPVMQIICFIVPIACVCYLMSVNKKFKKDLKYKVVSKILALYGNIYFTDKKNVIPFEAVRALGLYTRATSKKDDDTIVGLYKGCNFIINECKLVHRESRGENSETEIDFGGIILQIQMKKKFSGSTIVGLEGDIKKIRGHEPVELESVEFMKDRRVYTTDQVEARYILTTTFMERLDQLGKTFTLSRYAAGVDTANQAGAPVSAEDINAAVDFLQAKAGSSFLGKQFASMIKRSVGVSAAFVDGYAYLFIPTGGIDFFEINVGKNLLDEDQFYDIYKELEAILGIIDYMKFDQKLGL